MTLQWVPAHKGILGNEEANRIAREITETTGTSASPTQTAQEPNSRSSAQRYYERHAPPKKLIPWISQKTLKLNLDNYFKEAQNRRLPEAKWKGAYTWNLDGALPGTHTINLYNALSAQEAAILVQCRTNHSHLHANLYRMKVADTPKCECGALAETVLHVIYECPLLREGRQKAADAIGPRWRDLSYILGGWNP